MINFAITFYKSEPHPAMIEIIFNFFRNQEIKMKCVMVINHKLPLGLIANTAAVLAVSIGHKINDIVGEDVKDQDGYLHSGITQVSIPLLKGDNELIHSIRQKILNSITFDCTLIIA
jgi:hypothetical protein